MRILSIMTIDKAAKGMPSEEEYVKMDALIKEMRASGHLVDTGGVMDDMLELQVSRRGDKTTITDGPFTESKEVVGGYALMEVKDIIGNATCHIHEVSCA